MIFHIFFLLRIRRLVLPLRKSVLLITAKAEGYLCHSSSFVLSMLHTNRPHLADPATTIIKAVIRNVEGIEESTELLIRPLFIQRIQRDVKPKLTVVSANIKRDFKASLSVAEHTSCCTMA